MNGEKTLPLVTIITVVLNNYQGLRKTINSVLSQSYKNVEYIIIDGGSTDETKNLLIEYKEKINFTLSEPDNGIYDAMNKGIKHSSGEWINFMNAGDVFFNDDTIKSVVENIDSNYDLVYGHANLVRKNGSMDLQKASDNLDKIWKRMQFCHNSLFAKSTCLKEHMFNTSYSIAADCEFVVWCFKNNKTFKYINLIICNYQTGGISETSKVLRLLDRWHILLKYRIIDETSLNKYFFKRLATETYLKNFLFIAMLRALVKTVTSLWKFVMTREKNIK